MAWRATTIQLDDTQIDALERLAAREAEPIETLIRRAVEQYLAARDGDWGARFDALVEQVQSQLPADVTPEEIEADITAAREEVRAERLRRGSSTRDAANAPRR